MSLVVRIAGIAGIAAGIGIVLAFVIPRSGPTPTVVVTTDTEPFCQQLSAKLQELIRVSPRPPQPDVLSLGDEGRHLCDIGEVRGGILRLRRGVALMMHQLDQRGAP
ncbi:MAG TPA: hypothetical protein VFA03_10440 [Acetobacteraceae bacterium]|nr:hypothetical protein [Acetobacteraceae bacterium]